MCWCVIEFFCFKFIGLRENEQTFLTGLASKCHVRLCQPDWENFSNIEIALGVPQHNPNLNYVVVVLLVGDSIASTRRSVLARLTLQEGPTCPFLLCCVLSSLPFVRETGLLPKSRVTCSACCHWHCGIRAPVRVRIPFTPAFRGAGSYPALCFWSSAYWILMVWRVSITEKWS